MKHILLAGLVSLGLVSSAKAGMITLDFETPATGSNLLTTPLSTPYGDITVSSSAVFTTFNSNTQLGSNVLFTEIFFDFDVTSVMFDYSGQGAGVFTGDVLNAGSIVVDTFFDPSTSGTGIEGNVTLSGAGIRSFRFADEPDGGSFAYVDNVKITVASAVPEPSTFALLGIGGLALVGYGWRRKRQQAA